MLAESAGISENVAVTTSPSRLMIPPMIPPEVSELLYCTITLTLFEGFVSSGRRSGEIFELSANADPTRSKVSQATAHRDNCLVCFTMKDYIGTIWSNRSAI